MDRWNDYFRLTEGYLRNYRDLQMALAVMLKNRSEIVKEIEHVRSPIAMYGHVIHGGESLTHPECGAEKRIILESDVWALNRDIDEVEGLLQKVGYALAAMNESERACIGLRYFEGKAWDKVEAESPLCERQARRICNRAVWRMVNILFYHRTSSTNRQRFVFAK